ncbi:MAG: DUF4956 domain-containing protein [Phycisphaerales bacterium JB063]
MLIQLLAQGAEFSFMDQIAAGLAASEGEKNLGEIFMSLSCAALVGWVIGLGYRLSFTGKKLKPTMHHTLVMLCIGGALVWLVVGNNLVRAFGLAGTIGLIRYRTTVRDPKDTTVLFFAMILGMAIGLGHYATAIAGCLFVFVVLVVMRLTHTPPDKPDKAEKAKDDSDDEDLHIAAESPEPAGPPGLPPAV